MDSHGKVLQGVPVMWQLLAGVRHGAAHGAWSCGCCVGSVGDAAQGIPDAEPPVSQLLLNPQGLLWWGSLNKPFLSPNKAH